MEKEILTALISAGASFVGAGIGWIVAYKTVKAQVNQSVKNLAASHRAEIIRRQLDSLETLWGIFDATSRTGGQGRIIQHREGNVYLSIPNTKSLLTSLKKPSMVKVDYIFQKYAGGNCSIFGTIYSHLSIQLLMECLLLL